ncbi:MAG: ferrous iron transport protein A [Acidobacteria bacterium CG_4_9_14_3_um_filter_49_7]|nr:MAG: ferrous iron transport protein A [Acidobacteria bacterium CG_4_9_14_3_um_filter_49_7]
MKSLMELRVGETAKVMKISGGFRMQVQLKNLGFHEGVTVILAKKSAISGPLMVAVNGSNVAIGRGIASKILVSPAGDTTEDAHATDSAHGAAK